MPIVASFDFQVPQSLRPKFEIYNFKKKVSVVAIAHRQQHQVRISPFLSLVAIWQIGYNQINPYGARKVYIPFLVMGSIHLGAFLLRTQPRWE